MIASLRRRFGAGAGFWTPHLKTLAMANFLLSFGTGLLTAANTNFFINTLHLSGAQVLWLAGLREIPGLALIFIAAAITFLPLARRAAYAVAVMGIGYMLYTLVHSFVALVAAAIVASVGFHVWLPLSNALSLGLSSKQYSGRVLGALSSVAALATIVGMGGVAILSGWLSLRSFNAIGGGFMVLASLLIFRLPKNLGEVSAQPRILINRRYWLYYVLTFFEGSRTQVFGTFGTLILVRDYGLNARDISLLLLASAAVNFIAAPRLGLLLDRLGERKVLASSYVILALCFVGYATVHNALFLGGCLIGINLLTMLSIGLSTYVNRMAPSEELAPTLSSGVSVNHITSVSMSLVAGTLLGLVGYEALCWGAAAIIMLSVPFALAIRVVPHPEPSPVAAE